MENLTVSNIHTEIKEQKIYGDILLSNKRQIYIKTEIIGDPKLILKDIIYQYYIESGKQINIKSVLPLKLITEVENQVYTLIEKYNKEIDLLLENIPTIEY